MKYFKIIGDRFGDFEQDPFITEPELISIYKTGHWDVRIDLDTEEEIQMTNAEIIEDALLPEGVEEISQSDYENKIYDHCYKCDVPLKQEEIAYVEVKGLYNSYLFQKPICHKCEDLA